MNEGTVQDEDGSPFPDPLTLNYNDFIAKSAMTPVELTDNDIKQFWRTTHKVYGSAEYDDIVLTLNGVPHQNFLQEDQVIYFPEVDDIESSFSKTGLL